MSRVVDLHIHPDGSREKYDVYIGRRVRYHAIFTEDSKWANHFGRGPDSLAKYERHIRSTPELWDALEELDDKVLGCWCANTDSIESPLRCHGQVLMRLLQEKQCRAYIVWPDIPKEDVFYTPTEGDWSGRPSFDFTPKREAKKEGPD